MLIRMERVPVQPGLSQRDQNRAGQFDIFSTTFETFERNIRDQLARILRPGGFDPDWPDGEQPHIIGRARFGRITIANSDSGAAAYTDSAIDQAYRAVQDLFQS